MKIIEKNNIVKCECGCVMEYEKSDIRKHIESEMVCQLLFLRDYYDLYYIKCPQCGREIVLYSVYRGHHY